ncbi:MAG: metallophosphoesterase [Ruminococcus sp.]|nr:metallophosphoesterase [Ruminococcus sp.]
MSIKSSEAGAAALAGAVCGAYLTTLKNELTFYHYDIVSSKIPAGFDGFRILHLSDLHGKSYGSEGFRLVHSCEEFNPDIIVFSGDLFSRSENIFTIKKKVPLMKSLNKIAHVYYVWGNHEAAVPDKAKLLNDRLRHEGIHVLRNESVKLRKGSDHINLYGLELEEMYYKNPDGSYKNLPPVTRNVLNKKLGAPDTDEFNLLIAHTPMPFLTYADWGADLTLSGHCHGGIIRIGNVGLFSPERKLFPKYTKGLYSCETQNGDVLMEVSAGLGKFRINNPEMISICVLRRKHTSKD